MNGIDRVDLNLQEGYKHSRANMTQPAGICKGVQGVQLVNIHTHTHAVAMVQSLSPLNLSSRMLIHQVGSVFGASVHTVLG